jgi:hypothetical protein
MRPTVVALLEKFEEMVNEVDYDCDYTFEWR